MGAGLFVLAQPIAEHMFHEPKLVPLLQLFSLVVPFLTLSEVLVGAAHGFKKMEYSAIAQNFVQLLVRLFLIGALGLFGLNAIQVAIVFGLSDVAASVVLVYLLNKEFSWKRPLHTARHDVREISGYALPLWLSDLLKKFRKNIQTILLGALSTVTNVGIFTLVDRINLIGHIFYLSLLASVKPVLAELFARKDWEQMGRLYQTATRWTFMLNLPMFLIMVLFPGPLLSIFGRSFVDGAAALAILAWAELINAGTGICGSIIDMTGYAKLKLLNSILWITLGVGTNFLLIPRWGLVGAAVAVLIGITTINLLRVLEIWILFRLLPYNLSFVKPIVAGLAAFGVAQIMGQWFPAEANLLYTAIDGFMVLAVYASVLLLLGLAPEDRTVLAQMSRRVNSMFSRNRAVLARYLSARS
jgi:O-antigen/teichoic acid export membrane protein